MKMITKLLVASMFAPILGHAESVSFNKGNVRAEVTFAKGPFASSKKESVLRIDLQDRPGARKVDLKTPPQVELEMKMSSGNHPGGAPVEVKKTTVDNVFDATQIYFTMNGSWDVALTLKYQDGGTETQIFKVNVP